MYYRPRTLFNNCHMVHGMTGFLTSFGMYSQLLNQDFGKVQLIMVVKHVSRTFAGPFEFLTILTAIATVIYVLVAITSRFYRKIRGMLLFNAEARFPN